MFQYILSIPVFLLLCSYTPGVNGICDETELSCDNYTTNGFLTCTISASNGSRTSYLIEKCSSELAHTENAITFNVYLTENNETITLDIAEGITRFLLYVYNTISIEFNKTQIDIRSLRLSAYNPAVIYCPYDFLNYFPSVTYLYILNAVFDRFPYLNSTSLTHLKLYYLTLPNVVTIQPSMLILPNLARLVWSQFEDAQWYHVIPSSFDNTRISLLYLGGIQHLYSYQFANLTRLKYLYLLRFFTNFTFENNSLSGLDGLTHLYIGYVQTIFDLVSKYTFPSLILFDLYSSTVTTLEQRFFERQKQLSTIYGDHNPFHCGCEMAWLSHVANILGWSVSGTCETPSVLNGNYIADSSIYINCPNSQSYLCFNDKFICPPESICVNTADSAYCDCGDGYSLSGTNNLCQDINECTGTNSCEHICTNTVGSYSCSCNSGFTLRPPYWCEDTDECSTTNSCEHTCTNTVGSYTCSCLSGFTLQPPYSCEDTDECSTTNSCEHTCTNTVGSYTCSCLSGFTLQPPYCCEDTDECSTDNSCEHTCTNTVGSYTCSCLSGFTLQSDMSSCVSSGVNQLIAGTYFPLLFLLLQTLLLSLL